MRPAIMDALTTLSLLPGEYRDVLLLREVQKQSYDEIAATLGLSRDMVAVWLTRARRELMGRLAMGDNTLRESMRCGEMTAAEVAG